MTTALAEALAARLRTLPFAERVVGLARPVDENQIETFADDKQTTRRIKTPVALAYPLGVPTCDQNDKYLLPDVTTGSIFFFEDLGTTDYTIAAGLHGNESTLRLLGWLNPSRFSGPLSEGDMLAAILSALQVNRVAPAGPYHQLTVRATILPAEAALFSKYTYAADVTPLLYPPFQLFGLELKCRYHYVPDCPAAELPTLIDATPCPVFR